MIVTRGLGVPGGALTTRGYGSAAAYVEAVVEAAVDAVVPRMRELSGGSTTSHVTPRAFDPVPYVDRQPHTWEEVSVSVGLLEQPGRELVGALYGEVTRRFAAVDVVVEVLDVSVDVAGRRVHVSAAVRRD